MREIETSSLIIPNSIFQQFFFNFESYLIRIGKLQAVVYKSQFSGKYPTILYRAYNSHPVFYSSVADKNTSLIFSMANIGNNFS